MLLDPDLVSDLVNGLCQKDCICQIDPLHHLAKIAKFQWSYSQFTYSVSDTPQGVALRSNPSEGDILPYSPLLSRSPQQTLGCSLFMH